MRAGQVSNLVRQREQRVAQLQERRERHKLLAAVLVPDMRMYKYFLGYS